MCRHAAWLGAPRALASLLQEPAHGLCRQAYAPRMQRCGTVNADGFGMGWYDPDSGPEPVRYRRGVPIWADANLPGLARAARSGCLMAAVRSASPGMPVEESATAPFAEGRWLLSHNGRVDRAAVRPLAGDRFPESPCDSAWLAAAVFARLAAGARLGAATADVVALAGRCDPAARLNLLVGDGATLVATAWNETLFLHLGEGVLLASEPLDDRPGWEPVPDRHIVLATPDGVRVQPL
ncbi:ergothioneine biosynthesis protein EgtC [Sphaerisporangium krabiense]|uniref:Gamma-glutamyl-hercynylcysteine sulfoxide hydrolase n=1 Tax=Sphaerisporangium krabiense TaxID=763782 RepID=A0A7W8ZCU5_9ACTN|nr:ergothioneine biosynthesis protein EgtC [Sphaerisporangium krabiense]MBB5631679.1 glutamine amidotransferase [Sphaerisporangium krabiense]